jgi:hypothetical protein
MAKTEAVHDALTVIHHMPGRLRVRLPDSADSTGLVDAVRAIPGVRSAAWAPRTRGLLVLYDPGVTDATAILNAVAAHTDTELAPSPVASNGARSTLATAVTALAQDLNGRVTAKSGGAITLGILVPLALTMWAAAEVMRGRTGPLAWSSALWYAHGLFRDYNVPAREG